MSEGAFDFTSFLRSSDPYTEEERRREVRLASVGADPWGAGRDLPSLLQQVSLKGRRDSGGVFSDDMGSLPRRRVDLFSSLRLRKRQASENEGKEPEAQKEIRTILSNLRNKGQGGHCPALYIYLYKIYKYIFVHLLLITISSHLHNLLSKLKLYALLFH